MEPTNMRLPGVKRLLREAKELSEPTSQIHAIPLEENIFEWHFTIRGPDQTVFENGIYHGRILFPTEYPMKPPAIIFMTPNGRFQVDKKICLSISNFHPEHWCPSWGVRTMLMAIIGFFPTPPEGAVGSAEISDSEKIKLAQNSIHWACPVCKMKNIDILKENDKEEIVESKNEIEDIRSKLVLTSESIENIITSTPPFSPKPSVNQILFQFDQNIKSTNKEQFEYNLPFPWVPSVFFRIQKLKLKPVINNSEYNNQYNNQKYMIMEMPLYDWELEQMKGRVTSKNDPTSFPQINILQYIPNTKVTPDQAFKPLYHIKNISTLLLLSYLILLFGQRLIILLTNILS